MLDFDLAELYQVETRALNQAVKRNSDRFPNDFMFQVDAEEWRILKSQFVISSWGGSRKLPYAFTEQGLAMLSGVLNSPIAIQVNINIMRAFVAFRRLIAYPPIDKNSLLHKEIKELKEYIEEVFADQNDINEDTRMQLELIKALGMYFRCFPCSVFKITICDLKHSSFVSRNIKSSGNRSILAEEEFDELKANLIFQNGRSSWGGNRKLPYASRMQLELINLSTRKTLC